MLRAHRGDVDAGEVLAGDAVDLALRTDRADTQTDALMDLAEVLRLGERGGEAVPIVADALRRYELKKFYPQPLARKHFARKACQRRGKHRLIAHKWRMDQRRLEPLGSSYGRWLA